MNLFNNLKAWEQENAEHIYNVIKAAAIIIALLFLINNLEDICRLFKELFSQ